MNDRQERIEQRVSAGATTFTAEDVKYLLALITHLEKRVRMYEVVKS